ncbi:hypothetical protein PIB30_093365 [Stylosanthes scabra]|uniref:RNase H type-1 domain-containing protein n=1 Tax=Stylosanthes scabra TaxID=79078 RepID=A0ABU6XWW8_9FABA|nr:hypothetical protein [Stylosanthes scabra]
MRSKYGFGENPILKVKSPSLSLAKELNLHFHMQHASIASSLVDWTPPHGSTVKVNCDASVLDDHPVARFGCVIQDSNGSWIMLKMHESGSGYAPCASRLLPCPKHLD